VSHCGLPIYIKKYLKANEELWKLKIFHLARIYSSKNPLKEIKILQDIITLVTNLKFQHKSKYHLKKNPHIKIDLLLLPRGPKSLKLL
jgi:hypothetical protein